MTGLLDTHAFIWWDENPSKLSPAAVAFISNPANTIILSVVSVWEIIIKLHLGKVTLKAPLGKILTDQQANGIQIMQVTLDHVLAVEALPTPHKDPFDRLLVAQAIVESTELITSDPIFSKYPVKTVW